MVAIVLDGAYSKLRQTAREMAVWAIDTPANRATMIQLWSEAKERSNDLTLFAAAYGISKEAQLLSKVPTIELHHPDATALLLVDVPETSSLADGLLNFGYSLQKRGDALVAVKQEQIHE